MPSPRELANLETLSIPHCYLFLTVTFSGMDTWITQVETLAHIAGTVEVRMTREVFSNIEKIVFASGVISHIASSELDLRLFAPLPRQVLKVRFRKTEDYPRATSIIPNPISTVPYLCTNPTGRLNRLLTTQFRFLNFMSGLFCMTYLRHLVIDIQQAPQTDLFLSLTVSSPNGALTSGLAFTVALAPDRSHL
ncbi:hypothetical protein RRG08_028867 [Elysia crispata]|uniref:Uncharacterized protein n=1 Tax=Elysia crispata TaxID=231223 RepID=A0AAE0YZK5_9GAST|nr:hypothetical protein RRG08_028867 [Elysia crispata]